MFRFSLLLGLIFTLLNTVSWAEENGVNITVTGTRMTMEFTEVPYIYAKHYPSEMYYWWAVAENKRQAAKNEAFHSNVIGVHTEQYRGDLKYRNYNHSYKSSLRTFGRRGRISTFYNPDFKE